MEYQNNIILRRPNREIFYFDPYHSYTNCLIYSPINILISHFLFLELQCNKWGDSIKYNLTKKYNSNEKIKDIEHIVYGTSNGIYNGNISINRKFQQRTQIYNVQLLYSTYTFTNINDIINLLKNEPCIYNLSVLYDLGYEQKYKEPVINDIIKLNHSLYAHTLDIRYERFQMLIGDALINFSKFAEYLDNKPDIVFYTPKMYLIGVLFSINLLNFKHWLLAFRKHLKVDLINFNIVYIFFKLLYEYCILHINEIKEVEITPLFAEYIEQEIGIHYNDNIDEILEYIRTKLQNILEIFEKEFESIK